MQINIKFVCRQVGLDRGCNCRGGEGCVQLNGDGRREYKNVVQQKRDDPVAFLCFSRCECLKQHRPLRTRSIGVICMCTFVCVHCAGQPREF